MDHSRDRSCIAYMLFIPGLSLFPVSPVSFHRKEKRVDFFLYCQFDQYFFFRLRNCNFSDSGKSAIGRSFSDMFSGFVFVFCMIASPVSFIIWLIFYLLGCIQAFLMRKDNCRDLLKALLCLHLPLPMLLAYITAVFTVEYFRNFCGGNVGALIFLMCYLSSPAIYFAVCLLRSAGEKKRWKFFCTSGLISILSFAFGTIFLILFSSFH